MPVEQETATILNVDADTKNRCLTTRMLEAEGFQVKEAECADVTLRFAQGKPDVILLDTGLSAPDALEICRRLKQDVRTKSMPVVLVVTRAGLAQIRSLDQAAGADLFLVRPIEPALLGANIRSLVRFRSAGKEARDRARLWQSAVEAVSCGVCLVDEAGRIRKVNRALCKLAGKEEKELVGRPEHVLFGKAGLPADSDLERLLTSRRRGSADVRTGDRLLHVISDPLTDADGNPSGAIQTVIDVTDRGRAAEERDRLLREFEGEHARFEAVLQWMPAGVIVAEAPSGRIVLRNEQVESIFRGPFRIGGGPKDYLQYIAYRADGKKYLPESFPLSRTVASGEVIVNEEIRFDRGDGSRATLLVSSAPVRNREGYVIAGVAMLHDVSDRHVLEDQLRQSHKMEAMGRLAGAVAHDFNNLLTIIGGYGQMVLDSLKPDDSLRGDMEAILESSNRAAALTRQLLTFSRRQIVQPKVLDLNRQVSKMSRMLRRVVGEDVKLSMSLKGEPARIKLDPAQLEQVLLNLTLNARDAMPKGGTLTIRTANQKVAEQSGLPGSLRPGRYIMLSIADTGTGMDAETLSHLFEPFYTTKGKGKGTGLGLPTVYGIVTQGGGEVAVASEVGVGTTVSIYLPVAEESPKKSQTTDISESATTGTETILIVEDEAEVKRLASEMLTRQGYSVLEAGSGFEALRIWKEHRGSIDLVLTDVVMPEMSGPELATRLKALSPGVRLMYMSGYADDVLSRHGVHDTVTAFVPKPFTLDLLSRKVRSVLDREERR